MAADATIPLDESGPHSGATVLLDGGEWRVTDQSTYSTGEGYRVVEWCCEQGDVTGYLLKEGDPKQGTVRWFFTREIPTESVTVAGGERLADRCKQTTETQPPDTLEHKGETYHYADTTDGTHENASGARVRKVTWDYWDGGHARNLAVERWPDGTLDCYLGAYIESDRVRIRPASSRSAARLTARGSPFPVMVACLVLAFLIGFILGWPFDEAFSLAVGLAVTLGWIMVLPRVPLAGLAVLVAGGSAAAVFWQYPPFTTWIGLLTILGAPTLIGWVGRQRGYGGDRRAVQYAGAFALAAPLLGVGLYAYFFLAPGPHTAEQLWLAVGPTGLGGLAGFLVAGLTLGRDAP
jgi:hypothetical protein